MSLVHLPAVRGIPIKKYSFVASIMATSHSHGILRMDKPSVYEFAYRLMANGQVKIIGHAGVPGELEGARIDTIKSAIGAKAKHKWVSEGFSMDNASERGAYRANNLNLEEAYIFACYSSDTTALADYLLMPGGIYWGCQGSLGGTDFLTSYTKPK